ncbi:MAG: phosphatase PAP2 family protein [Treponema sp.]|jgi:membrane-associated phospholipid phosphatase|nr:phosphatase PAP2 family protein [Treponema sp.]
MESTLLWGLDLIRSIQSHAGPALTVLMKLLTNAGAASVCLALLPLVFWCFDEEKGLRLSLTLLVSLWINLVLKQLLAQPRPFWDGWDPSVAMVRESTNGFPSGHAQISLVLWVIVTSWTGKKWAFPLAVLLSLLVGFSRLYLGVHFPTDLLGGWVLGALTLAVYFLAGARIRAALIRGGLRFRMILCSGLAFVMILYRPQVELLVPGALVLGLGLGYCVNRARVGFRAGPRAGSKTAGGQGAARFPVLGARFAIGMAGLAALVAVLGLLAPEEASPLYPLFVFARFALAGFWVCAAAPWLFLRLRLAEAETKTEAEAKAETETTPQASP